MQPLYYTYSKNHYAQINSALFHLDKMGLTAQWYAENYSTQLGALRLQHDMGMLESFEVRSSKINEHPLLPYAELFREKMLKPPFVPEIIGIPCEWPRSYLLNILRHEQHKPKIIQNALELASTRKNDWLYFYSNGIKSNIGMLSGLKTDEINELLQKNPWSIYVIDSEDLEQTHWDNALINESTVLYECDLSLFSKKGIEELCRRNMYTFKTITEDRGLSLLELPFDHDELLEISLNQCFDPVAHRNIFSLDEMLTIILCNNPSRFNKKIISYFPDDVEKILNAFSCYEEGRHEIMKFISPEKLVELHNRGIVDLKDIPQVIHASLEKADPELAEKVCLYGKYDDRFDVPF